LSEIRQHWIDGELRVPIQFRLCSDIPAEAPVCFIVHCQARCHLLLFTADSLFCCVWKEDVDRDGYNADIPFARNYRDVVKTYGLNSSIDVEITADQDMNSDQAPFWKKRIPAVWLIENDYDYSLPKEQAYKYFNATYMHTTEDKLSKCLTGGYYTAVVKALLGLTAHEAGIQ